MKKIISAFLLAASLIIATWSNQSYARQTSQGGPVVLPEVVVECVLVGTYQITYNFIIFSITTCYKLYDCSYGYELEPR